MYIDPRSFSQKAHTALKQIATETQDPYYISPTHHSKASSVVQGLAIYISTWGLHRLSGDAKKFLRRTSEDTTYKGKIYRKFLSQLRELSPNDFDFDIEDETTLIHLPLRQYTALNQLAIHLSKEWSFWASVILGEAEQ
jgi:hypothetical protein